MQPKQEIQEKIKKYLDELDSDKQDIFKNINEFIFKISKLIEPEFSYGMPTYKMNGKVLIHLGIFKNHIGIYALPQKEIQTNIPLKKGRGSIQLPLNLDISLALIESIIQAKIHEINQDNNV